MLNKHMQFRFNIHLVALFKIAYSLIKIKINVFFIKILIISHRHIFIYTCNYINKIKTFNPYKILFISSNLLGLALFSIVYCRIGASSNNTFNTNMVYGL